MNEAPFTHSYFFVFRRCKNYHPVGMASFSRRIGALQKMPASSLVSSPMFARNTPITLVIGSLQVQAIADVLAILKSSSCTALDLDACRALFACGLPLLLNVSQALHVVVLHLFASDPSLLFLRSTSFAFFLFLAVLWLSASGMFINFIPISLVMPPCGATASSTFVICSRQGCRCQVALWTWLLQSSLQRFTPLLIDFLPLSHILHTFSRRD